MREPAIRFGGVVNRKVEYNFYVAFVEAVQQFFKVVFRAERTVDFVIIRCVILMVGRRREYRWKPDSLYAETFARIYVSVIEVIHSVDDTAQISRSVTVWIRKRTYEYLIEHALVVVNRINLRGGRAARA